MLTEQQKRRMTHTFRIADMDHDGVLEREDYEMYAKNMAQAFGVQTDSSAYTKLHNQIMKNWEQQKMMTGGKEKVTLESFLAFFEKLLATPQSAAMYAEAYVEGSLALWHTVDPSGPMNTATLDRFKKFYRAFNLSEQMASESFGKMDTNHDGKMDRHEMVAALTEFLTSDNPDAPGAHFFGPY